MRPVHWKTALAWGVKNSRCGHFRSTSQYQPSEHFDLGRVQTLPRNLYQAQQDHIGSTRYTEGKQDTSFSHVRKIGFHLWPLAAILDSGRVWEVPMAMYSRRSYWPGFLKVVSRPKRILSLCVKTRPNHANCCRTVVHSYPHLCVIPCCRSIW